MTLTAVESVLKRDLSLRVKFGLERDTVAGTIDKEMKRRRHCKSLETGIQVQEAA